MKLLLTLLLFTVSNTKAEWEKLKYTPDYAPADNPLKGFIPYSGKGLKEKFPHSMEWFYIKMSDIMDGPTSFTFDKSLEVKLKEISSRGNQAVFRIYLDYPGKKHGVPEFLIKNGLKMIPYQNNSHDNKGGLSPDYNDENLIRAIEDSIKEMGKLYDGDPRIGFITVGYLGHWGEWHTYPNSHLMADREIQLRFIKAFSDSFKKTKFLLRYPKSADSRYPCGFHDDSFTNSTIREKNKDWHFMNQMKKHKKTEWWKTQPIGGELYPPFQKKIWSEDPPKKAQNYKECVKQSHCSWLINNAVFSGNLKKTELVKAIEGAKCLGYEFFINSYKFEGDKLHVKISNKGVAPFYYRWPIFLTDIQSKETLKTEWDIRNILPGDTKTFSSICKWDQVRVTIPNPMKGGKEIQFANKNSLLIR